MAEMLTNEDRAGPYPYKNRSVLFMPGDILVLEWIMEFLGCSQSEAIRSAVRAFASNLSHIDNRDNPAN